MKKSKEAYGCIKHIKFIMHKHSSFFHSGFHIIYTSSNPNEGQKEREKGKEQGRKDFRPAVR